LPPNRRYRGNSGILKGSELLEPEPIPNLRNWERAGVPDNSIGTR